MSMQASLTTILTIIGGFAAIVAALVAPLYIMLLRMRGSDAEAVVERGNLSETQSGFEQELEALRGGVRTSHEELQEDLAELRADLRATAERSERNQRHIHQLLLGEHNGEDDDIGNPHHRAEYCPLPDECPFCSNEAAA